jgi:hypothetical protein
VVQIFQSVDVGARVDPGWSELGGDVPQGLAGLQHDRLGCPLLGRNRGTSGTAPEQNSGDHDHDRNEQSEASSRLDELLATPPSDGALAWKPEHPPGAVVNEFLAAKGHLVPPLDDAVGNVMVDASDEVRQFPVAPPP